MNNEEKGMQVSEQAMTARDVKLQVNRIQEVMEAVMHKDEHYGIIPGCQKPSLLKSGAEKLAMTFRLSPDYDEMPGTVENESFISYKIKCTLTHMTTGQIVGHGLGACNNKEKKYKERFVYANKATDEEKTTGREGKRGTYKGYYVPVDPWEIQNTLYKMACKRALIAAILNATAASDCFSQDLEDLPEGMAENETPVQNTKPKVEQPVKKEKVEEDKQQPANKAQKSAIETLSKNLTADDINKALDLCGLESAENMTFEQAGYLIKALGEVRNQKKAKSNDKA